MSYSTNDIVLLYKRIGNQDFAFLLVSQKDNNETVPEYTMVNGIPNFSASGWFLLNPTTYLLQNLGSMRSLVVQTFNSILENHVEKEHGLIGSNYIENNLVRKDYTNLNTGMSDGVFSLNIVDTPEMKICSNGIIEYSATYSFDTVANQQITISDARHFLQKSPIWDESDDTIFAKKYMEDDMFEVTVNKTTSNPSGITFTNLREGTNIFHKKIEFATPFINDQYMVFFDAYGRGQFVFGYDKADIEAQDEPTYDAIVSKPMLMNKTAYGFDIVLPIHTHFNSIRRYKVGVPWKNEFRLQAVGRYR